MKMKIGTKVAVFLETPTFPHRLRYQGVGKVIAHAADASMVHVRVGYKRVLAHKKHLVELSQRKRGSYSIQFFTDASFVAEVSVTHPHQTNALIAFVKGRFHLVASATPESPSLGAYDSFPLALDAVLGVAADLKKVVA
jgi:hypothetical protein